MMVYTHTDIGHGRSENQDSVDFALLEDAGFAVVCDGMGGSNAGREASSRAVAIIKERIGKSYRSDYDSNRIRNFLIDSYLQILPMVWFHVWVIFDCRGVRADQQGVYPDRDPVHTAGSLHQSRGFNDYRGAVDR